MMHPWETGRWSTRNEHIWSIHRQSCCAVLPCIVHLSWISLIYMNLVWKETLKGINNLLTILNNTMTVVGGWCIHEKLGDGAPVAQHIFTGCTRRPSKVECWWPLRHLQCRKCTKSQWNFICFITVECISAFARKSCIYYSYYVMAHNSSEFAHKSCTCVTRALTMSQ